MTTTTASHIASPSLTDTLGLMLRAELPNFFRLYVNPFVTQVCYSLDRYVRTTWKGNASKPREPFQSFLANSFDEALGGAIKLARYCCDTASRPTEGLIVDPARVLGYFERIDLPDGGRVTFVPGLQVVNNPGDVPRLQPPDRFGYVVVIAADSAEAILDADDGAVGQLIRRANVLLIVCVTRASLMALRLGGGYRSDRQPDIVVFDESFTNRDVPFAAFVARKALFDHWNRRGRSNFHSTTYQPNTVSNLHFMRCLEKADPEFFAAAALDLRRIESDFGHRCKLFLRLYGRSLYKVIRQAGCATPDVRAAGDFVTVNGRQVFDGVSGVACSIRGHNPPDYLEEIRSFPSTLEPAAELGARLAELTGLGHMVPAVSGAGAVENGLRLALGARHPRRHVLALRGGFGGKSLLSLVGTAKPFYKEHLGPLYADVTYVDPFAADALEQIDAVLARHPVAVAQIELVQGVGGVRAVPEAVLRRLDARRRRHDYLLLVDEIQTGMYRTGPFIRSRAAGLAPDLLVIGKGVSDMMFPFALTLYSAAVARKLGLAGADLADDLRRRYGYEYGWRTVLNVLNRAPDSRFESRVVESGALMAHLLRESLVRCPAVREVRAFGMLIGIELDASRWPQSWAGRRLIGIYLSAMLRHPRFPVLVGFCQYELNVLKVTPPLTADRQHLREACRTIAQVLKTPFPRLAAGVVVDLVRSRPIAATRRPSDGSPFVPTDEPAAS